MKYIKKFTDTNSLIMYKKTNFVTPHVYFNNSAKTFDYMKKYIPLEYISSTSTGGQYIDLDCKLFENTDQIQFEMKYNFKGNGKDNHNQAVILGANDESNNNYPGMILRKFNNGTQFKIKFVKFICYINGTNISYSHNNGTYAIDARNTPYPGIYTLNVITNEWTPTENNSSTHNKSTTLFCGLDSSGNPFRYSETDLYYLKIKKGDTVIRNLIPVKKPSTNEIGLYDMENDYFYVSQGDEPFVAGPNL